MSIDAKCLLIILKFVITKLSSSFHRPRSLKKPYFLDNRPGRYKKLGKKLRSEYVYCPFKDTLHWHFKQIKGNAYMRSVLKIFVRLL